jgi:hypothetical protein
LQNSKRRLSDSVYRRWQYGRQQKYSFYPSPLNQQALTDNFEELASSPHFPKLNNKVAVIYIDGNAFSRIQYDVLSSADKDGEDIIKAQRDFDYKIGAYHQQFLSYIFEQFKHNPARYPEAINHEGKLCFETLLWGGDEMLFVMPARFGFEFIQAFFLQASTWFVEKFSEQGKQKIPLSYAAGVVFCHAKTPIQISRDLAREMLADRLKASMKAQGVLENAWDYGSSVIFVGIIIITQILFDDIN